MKVAKHISLTLALVCFCIAAMLDNAIIQLITAVFMFVFFQVWMMLVKNDRKHSGH